MRRVGLCLMMVFGVAWSVGAKPAFLDYELQWIFPQKLGGLDFKKVEKYDEKRFGYSVFYQRDEAFKAEVSVYNLGFSTIPDGYKDPLIAERVQVLENQLKLKQKQEKIFAFKKKGKGVVPKKGSIQFSMAAFQYLPAKDSKTKEVQMIYVVARRNNFVKLLFTFDPTQGKKAKMAADQMVAQLIKIMQAPPPDEQTLLLASCEVFLNNPSDYSGRTAAQYFIKKAQDLDNINIYTHLFIWSDMYPKPPNTDLLVAAYFAGMIQVVVPQKLESGGEVEAFTAMLNTYKFLRAKDQILVMPKLDEWAATPDKKALFKKLLIIE